MKPHSFATLASGVSIVALSAMAATSVHAQDDTTGPGDITVLKTIVLSGEKVERSLEDTASSVAALTEEDIDERVDDATIADAIEGIPNVAYYSTVGAPVIRGQDTQGPNYGSTAFFGGTIPRATINLDGHYLSYYEYVFGATAIWDVESVEVFRGPQTTSQGANAIAGAIIVDTKDPTFTPEASYQAEYASYNRKRASFAVSGPLSDDLAGRIAVDYFGRETFIDYINSSFAKGDTDQDLESFTGRAKLLWEPSEIPGLSAKLTYSHIYNNRPTWEAASLPYEDLESATATMPSWSQDSDTAVLDVDYDFGNGLRLFNQSQFSHMHVDRVSEPFNNGSAIVDQQNLSNEARLTFGDPDSTFSGVGGLYLARTTSDDTLYTLRGATVYLSDFDDTKDNLGLFTEMTYRLTDRWTLTGGLRYQRDHIRRSGTSGYAAAPLDYDETFDAWLPKISLAYDLTPDVTVGALVNRGYNPGGVNLSFASADYITFDAETVWNYELFGRARMLDDRLTLTANLFYSDYTDSQRLLPDYLGAIPYGAIVVNADHAHTYGLELAADYQVLDNLRVNAGAGLLKTEIGTFVDSLGVAYTGNEFGRAPGYMFSFGMDWDVTEKVRLTGNVRHTDGYYSTDENDPAYAVGSYTVANARVSYALHDNMELYGYVNNIFDERAPTYLADDRSIGGIVANMLEPRTFGVGVKGSF